uniref:DEAD/DEAH box helicase n=1 Tax=Ignisphaera aggregans TaxID=334771 RepID=A0A7J3I8N3_9CREN
MNMVFVFRVKKLATTSDSSVNVDLIADAIVSGGDSSLLLYRLNPVKAAKVGFQRAISILDSIGVYLPAEIKSLIESLEREYIDVYLTLESPDIIMYTGSSKFVRSLRAERLVIFDRKTATLRLMPKNLHRVLEIAERQGLKCKLGFELNYRASFEAHLKIELRDYQLEAYRAWVGSGYRGVVVLPVAAGKTMVALKAIEELGVKTLILVPTIDLLNQWSENIVRYLSISVNKIGIYGSGRRELNDVTIMTYDSAYINLERYPNLFGLVIADECHHAVSPSYRRALENLTAPYRMGLTATPYRSDGLHKHYEDVIGPIVYSLESESLQLRGYLARHREEKVYVTLPEEELGEYRRLMRIYLEFCRKRFPSIRDPRERFRRVLELASRDQAAREALRAKHRARRIALSNEKKIAVVEELLSRYKDEKILIFSRFTDIVREISRRFLIPRILHDTPDEERKEYLKMFREGRIRVLATAMALDEGVDVPDASVAIVVSGTGSHREYIQRLGRILRPKSREAILIEIITRRTIEPSMARRRRRFDIFVDREERP